MSRLSRWKSIFACGTLMTVLTGTAAAQTANVHYQHRADMPPGSIGQWQLQRGGPLAGYFQPVRLTLPEGASVSFAISGQFGPTVQTPTSGLLIGQVYRLRVQGIPDAEGVELFPTIEVIDRTYPPANLAWKFPIEVEINRQDIRDALSGKFVTRVIYIEDPNAALPVRRDPKNQEYFDVRPGKDPLAIADGLGRPVAIIRLGSRTPQNPLQPSPQFLYGSPPLYLPANAITNSGAVQPSVLEAKQTARLPDLSVRPVRH
ncbi:MAG: hypothetical protein MPJ50_18660 [Pirellulales bacterium]|nr:hypothetical protein [Pirellulales bacterium]